MTKSPSLRTAALNLGRNFFRLPPLERALAARTQGRDSASWIGRLPPNHYQYPSPSPRRARREGFEYDLDLAHLNDWAIFYGLREPESERLFASVRPGDVVLDVGANIGRMSLNLARAAGPTGRVHGFEPDPAMFAKFKRNLALNPGLSVIAQNLALAERPGELNLFRVNARNPGMNRVLPAGAGGDSVRVPALPLDQYVAERGLTRVDLIKIDVEGFEMQVLRGARETLVRHRPLLYLEVIDAMLKPHGDSARGLIAWAAALGYRAERADGAGPLPEAALDGFHGDVILRADSPKV